MTFAALALALALQAQDTGRARVLALLAEARFAGAEQAATAANMAALAGEAQLGRGRWREAEASFRRALGGNEADSASAVFGLARLAELHGRRQEARSGYIRLVAMYNRMSRRYSAHDLVAFGAALERLSQSDPQRSREALNIYDQATRLDPANPDAALRAADILLARYNGVESGEGYEAVLRRFPGNARALLGLAQVRRFLGDGDPIALAESSLAHNPELAAAHLFLARLALETDEWPTAAARTDSALALDPHSRDGWALRAALAFVRGDSAAFEAADRAVRADDPSAADHLAASADAAARARRYAEAATLAERAVARDTLSWRGWAILGANQLRLGDLARGRASLARAFAGDPYDLWTKNTLDLLDTLQRFPQSSSARFRFVMDARESALLTLYFAPLAEEAYDKLAARYGIRPQTPIRVEVYPSHADFSVRTVGLAGIGALGVCFGSVIAMDSPSARDRGQFNWGTTLWHETAHTFHLALSRSRVPRWFTEGFAVLEERRARPGWGAQVSPEFLAAWLAGRLPPLSRLNEGFIRPADGPSLMHAYTMASFAAEYLESLNDSVAPRMLRVYGEGLDTRSAVQRVLALSSDSLDAAFTGWMNRRFAPQILALADSSFAFRMRVGQQALRAGRRDQAREEYTRAKAAFPEYAGPDNAYLALARLASERGDHAAAAAELEALLAVDESAYDAAIELAGHYEALDRPADAAGALNRALMISPLDPAVHERLAGLADRLGRHAEVVRERRALIALAPTDRAGAWFRLALALRAAGNSAEARRAVVRALEHAPGYADAQELLLDLVDARP